MSGAAGGATLDAVRCVASVTVKPDAGRVRVSQSRTLKPRGMGGRGAVTPLISEGIPPSFSSQPCSSLLLLSKCRLSIRVPCSQLPLQHEAAAAAAAAERFAHREH